MHDEKRPNVTILSSQPIILICRAEEVPYERHLAYWPTTYLIGLRLIQVLDALVKRKMALHVKMMNLLQDLATNQATEESLTLLCKYFKVECVEELGHFMILKECDSLCILETEKEYTIDEAKLAPHLYHHLCHVFH